MSKALDIADKGTQSAMLPCCVQLKHGYTAGGIEPTSLAHTNLHMLKYMKITITFSGQDVER